MSTSNSYSWNQTTSEIINRSLRIVNAIPVGSSPSQAEYDNALRTLNAINKRISIDGIKLWSLDELTYTISTPSVVIGTNNTYQFCVKNHTSSISNQPISGATSSDYWSNGGDVTTNIWSAGTSYTSNIEISLSGNYSGVESAFWRDNSTDYNLSIIPKQQYNKLEDKFTRTTVPTHISVENAISGINIIIYPVPYISSGRLHIIAVKTLQDFVSTTDNGDYPAEWVDVLTYLLAASLADEYQLDMEQRSYLQAKAKEMYREAKGMDRETISPPCVRGAYSVRR
jgi:hypothetical protein